MNRSKYLDFITEKLNLHSYIIDSNGKLNLLTEHVRSEIFYRDFLNLLYGYNLEKTPKNNEAGIDLVDKQNNIVISVSANASRQKIEDSLNNLHSNYSGYVFKFISISKNASRLKNKKYTNPHGLVFNPQEDIYDIDTLLNEIARKKIESLEEIYNFIKKCLGNNELGNLIPEDRLKAYLKDIDGWKKVESGLETTYHYAQSTESTIVEIVENDNINEGNNNSYKELWLSQFPDPRYSYQYEYFAKCGGAKIDNFYIVCCDNGFITAQPKEWIKITDRAYYKAYYFVEDSIEYLAGQVIQKLGGARLRTPYFYNEFKLFKSTEDANKSIEADFSSDKNYVYYCFDEKTRQCSRIANGVSDPINCIP